MPCQSCTISGREGNALIVYASKKFFLPVGVSSFLVLPLGDKRLLVTPAQEDEFERVKQDTIHLFVQIVFPGDEPLLYHVKCGFPCFVHCNGLLQESTIQFAQREVPPKLS